MSTKKETAAVEAAKEPEKAVKKPEEKAIPPKPAVCELCGGEIDPETMVCGKCGAKYSLVAEKPCEPEPIAPEKPDPYERVEFFVDRGYERDDPVKLIAVNGVNYPLRKGQMNTAPRCVKEEYERSRRAEAHVVRSADKFEKESKFA